MDERVAGVKFVAQITAIGALLTLTVTVLGMALYVNFV